MTNQTNHMSKPNQHRRTRSRFLGTAVLPVVLAATVTIGLTGCGEDAEPVQVVDTTPAPPPPPPPPSVTPISDLMAQYNIDQRISLEEEYAPSTDPSRIAVLQFFHAMVTADNIGMSSMLSSTDQEELSDIVDSGNFQNAVAGIGAVQLRSGITPNGDEAVVAIIQTTGEYQPQLWRFEADNFGTSFTSGPTPMNVMEQLSGTDWVGRWYELLDEELEIALRLDEEIEMPQRDLSKDTNAANTGSGGGTPAGPITVPDRPTEEPPSFDPTGPR